MGTSRRYSRRAVLGAAAAATAGTAAAAATGASAAAADDGKSTRDPVARHSMKVVDDQHRQRFLADTEKPPIIIDGKTYPPSQRQGPDHATWLIFNDDDGSERGGIVASTDGGQLSFDYPNAQGMTLLAQRDGQSGTAGLFVAQMPDPNLGPTQVTQVFSGVWAGWGSNSGSQVILGDTKGRARVVVQVDTHDVPSILFLDEEGKVTFQLPPAPAPQARSAEQAPTWPTLPQVR